MTWPATRRRHKNGKKNEDTKPAHRNQPLATCDIIYIPKLHWRKHLDHVANWQTGFDIEPEVGSPGITSTSVGIRTEWVSEIDRLTSQVVDMKILLLVQARVSWAIRRKCFARQISLALAWIFSYFQSLLQQEIALTLFTADAKKSETTIASHFLPLSTRNLTKADAKIFYHSLLIEVEKHWSDASQAGWTFLLSCFRIFIGCNVIRTLVRFFLMTFDNQKVELWSEARRCKRRFLKLQDAHRWNRKSENR